MALDDLVMLTYVGSASITSLFMLAANEGHLDDHDNPDSVVSRLDMDESASAAPGIGTGHRE